MQAIRKGILSGESAVIQNHVENAGFEDTGFPCTLSLSSGKHRMVSLYCRMEPLVVQSDEQKRDWKNGSDKMPRTNRKGPEAGRLIIRTEYPQVQSKAEYSLRGRGKSRMVAPDPLCIWGKKTGRRNHEWISVDRDAVICQRHGQNSSLP